MRQTTRRVIGPQMARATQFVAANPGCTQQRAALAIGPNGSHFFGAAAVQRAIRAGLIRAERGKRGYALYPA